MSVRNNRREFFGLAAGALTTVSLFQKRAMGRSAADKPALLGGSPVHTGSWPRWPEWRQAWEPRILQVLRSGQWEGARGHRGRLPGLAGGVQGRQVRDDRRPGVRQLPNL